MDRRVTWTESAWHELQSAADYIVRDSPRYAAALIDEARSAARSLRRFPLRGRIVPEMADRNIRELFMKSYRLIYEVQDQRVTILAFVHGARRFSGGLG